MNRFIPALAAACFALFAAPSFAQMQPGPRMGPGQAGPDHQQMRERYQAAREACKSATDQRGCMTQQFCSKAQDPAKCLEMAKHRGEHMKQKAEMRQKMHEACNGKRGADLESCMKGQKQALMQQRMEMRQKAHEACNGKRGDELMNCLRDQRGAFPGGMGHHGMRS